MIATKDGSAFWDGRAYEFKRGERVDAPPALIRKLKEQGAVKAPARKKGNADD